MKTVLTLCLIAFVAMGQTKTRKIGTKKVKDTPAREITAGNKSYKSGSYKKALAQFEEALAALEGYKSAI